MNGHASIVYGKLSFERYNMFQCRGNHVLKEATVRGKNMLPIGATFKGKNMLHLWSIFFPFKVAPMGIK